MTMYLKTLTIEGYKHFGQPFTVNFVSGLNVLVGENGSGKTAIIDAIRQLLLEDEYGRGGTAETDFHKPFEKGASASASINISAAFDGLTKEEIVAFLPWTLENNMAQLSLFIENKETTRGWFKRVLWGGVSRASMFERELFDRINCIYLPPMRDAEAKLREGKGSRLARLLKNLNRHLLENSTPPLEDEIREFNKKLATEKGKSIDQANTLIRTALTAAIGSVFGQDTLIRFSESSFSRIVESLRLFFYPRLQDGTEQDLFRSLEENSLGYNNLLYLATVLAELSAPTAKDDYLRILLIEEPEAHLHPQLQIRLLKYLEATANTAGIQVVVTTHSPVLASAVSLYTMIHLSVGPTNQPKAVAIHDCNLDKKTEAFISRWLDATKSVLLFAKAVILVEGIAESLLLPILAKRVLHIHNSHCTKPDRLPESLEDAGVAIINMNGIYFRHFMQLFCSLDGHVPDRLPILCAGITDNDPADETDATDKKIAAKPTPLSKKLGVNPALALAGVINASNNARLFANELKTLEYDLAMAGKNITMMLRIAAKQAKQSGAPVIRKNLVQLARQDWSPAVNWSTRADAAYYLLEHIEKGEFAQLLASHLSELSAADAFAVPEYIQNAIYWSCGKKKV
jgi:predicted ATP-dependent endonuclease of OLD family